MNMVQLGYWLAGVLIAMVVGVHGARLLKARRVVAVEATE